MDNSDSPKKKFIVTGTPHTRSGASTREIMTDVLIALAPAAVMGAYFFGFKAIAVMVLAMASAVLFELLYQIIMKKELTIGDFSAVVTGLLLAFNMPASSPFWMPVVGSFFAIVVVKQLFGGLGQNFLNPALAARAFLLTAYPSRMTDWSVAPRAALDAMSGATPLGILKEGGELALTLKEAFFGISGGCIGETCAIALIIGGLYLIIRKVISWRIPVIYIAASALGFYIFGRDSLLGGNVLMELLTGGLLLGAVFMATDYTTSPVTPVGQLIFGFGCAVLTVVIRIYGGYPEGVSFAILLMNLTVPIIDRATRPKVYGHKRSPKKQGEEGEKIA